MWVSTRECVPMTDGEYLVQTVYGCVTSMNYTTEAGWNTHYANGELERKHAIEDLYVVRWLLAEAPGSIPQEWKDAYHEARKGGE